MKDITHTITRLQDFQTPSLRGKISSMELRYQGADSEKSQNLLEHFFIDPELFQGAMKIREMFGQIDVIIHTLGILTALPKILNTGEIIEYLSLGAGNTGRNFDLETNLRIAEFKFITWQGGAESIRQNQLFKDFYELAEYETNKEKCLYVLGKEIPLRFLNGKRALDSVLSKNRSLWEDFHKKYNNRFITVNEYFEFRKDSVKIVDIKGYI